MRREIVDFLFSVAESSRSVWPQPHSLYLIIVQSLGSDAAANPMSGYRAKAAQVVAQVAWPRFYDLLLRLWPEFQRQGYGEHYRENINRLLSAYSVVRELSPDGRLERVLPQEVSGEVGSAFGDLAASGFQGALEALNLAREAFDARPRRDRDAASNAFAAMEASAKARFALPDATFGEVLNSQPCRDALSESTRRSLRGLEQMRHNHVGHGMTEGLDLRPEEIDYFYVSCVVGARLFARLT